MVSSELHPAFGTLQLSNTLINDYHTNKNLKSLYFDAMKNFDQAPSKYFKDDHLISNDQEASFKGVINLNEDKSNKDSPLEYMQSGSAVDDSTYATQRNISSVESFSSLEKLERRDSGFHTLSRSAKYNGGVSPLADNSEHSTVEPKVCADSSKQSLSPEDIKINVCIDSSLLSDPSLVIIEDASKKVIHENPKCEGKSLIAQKLFHMKGFDRQDVVKYLTSKDSFSNEVAEKYMDLFNFNKIPLENALRILFKRVPLIGETQDRERILQRFSQRYSNCNKDFLGGSVDSIHTLVCAIVLLNTDLHDSSIAMISGHRRMTSKQFQRNLEGLGPSGTNFSPDLLKECYKYIRKQPLPVCELESASRSNNSFENDDRRISAHKSKIGRSVSSVNPKSRFRFNQHSTAVPLTSDSAVLRSGGSRNSKTLPKKQGVLWRKCILESDGTRTSKRKRRWKLFLVQLQGLDLHLAKRGNMDGVKISLHHCLASVDDAPETTKRSNVFRITHSNSSVVLYQANSPEERKVWVDTINRNVAMLSTAPLSAPVGSQLKFQKPLMPSVPTTLPVTTQFDMQQKRLLSLRDEFDKLSQSNVLNEDSSPLEKQYFVDKEAYLKFEIEKYAVYTQTLQEIIEMQRKLASLPEDGNHRAETQSLQSLSPSEPCSSKDSSGTQSVSASDIPERMCDLHVSGSPQPSQMSPTLSMPNLVPTGGLFGRFTNSLTRPPRRSQNITRSSQVVLKRVASSKRNTNNNSNNAADDNQPIHSGSSFYPAKSFFTRMSSFRRGSFTPNINPHGQPIDRASPSIRRSPFYASFHLGNRAPKLATKTSSSWNGSEPARLRKDVGKKGGASRYSYMQAIRDPNC